MRISIGDIRDWMLNEMCDYFFIIMGGSDSGLYERGVGLKYSIFKLFLE